MKKGVYIIKNKTLNKFYVGQSKNIHTRIFKQHFNNGSANNIIFAKHWFDNHKFQYKYQICKTKDELDRIEKEYIDKYDSFKQGYNKTSGNT